MSFFSFLCIQLLQPEQRGSFFTGSIDQGIDQICACKIELPLPPAQVNPAVYFMWLAQRHGFLCPHTICAAITTPALFLSHHSFLSISKVNTSKFAVLKLQHLRRDLALLANHSTET